MKLEKKERELKESVERGEWKDVRKSRKEAARYQDYAKGTFRKDRRVNIRISEKDLVNLKKRAIEEGLPYQTLISSVLHKFITGRLRERSS
jgi:predicted DNA binding CopG/RHH family protein